MEQEESQITSPEVLNQSGNQMGAERSEPFEYSENTQTLDEGYIESLCTEKEIEQDEDQEYVKDENMGEGDEERNEELEKSYPIRLTHSEKMMLNSAKIGDKGPQIESNHYGKSRKTINDEEDDAEFDGFVIINAPESMKTIKEDVKDEDSSSNSQGYESGCYTISSKTSTLEVSHKNSSMYSVISDKVYNGFKNKLFSSISLGEVVGKSQMKAIKATEEEQQERKEQSEIEGREESELTESNLDNIPESDKVFDGVEFPENIDEGKNSTPIRMKVDEEDSIASITITDPIIKTQEIPNRFPGLEQGKAFPARSTDIYSREPGKVNHQAELLGGENPKGKDLVHQEEIDENTSDESAFEYSNTRNTNTLITDSQASATTFSVPELIPDHFSDQNSQLSPQHPLPAPT